MLSIAGIVLGIGYAIDDRKLKEFGKSEILPVNNKWDNSKYTNCRI